MALSNNTLTFLPVESWSFDIGYGGHFMIAKNIILSKAIAIGGRAFVYPYNFSDKYQSSIHFGLNRDFNRFRVGLYYERFIDNIYDTKGIDVPGPREYRMLQTAHLGFGYLFK